MTIFLKIRYFNNKRKGIDLAKSSNNKKRMICQYWFFNHGFKFYDSLCNGSHNLKILSVNISDIAAIFIRNFSYSCVIRTFIVFIIHQ